MTAAQWVQWVAPLPQSPGDGGRLAGWGRSLSTYLHNFTLLSVFYPRFPVCTTILMSRMCGRYYA